MSSSGNATTGALVAANRPELLEGLGSVDGWLVGAGALVNVVDGAVGGDFALLGGAAGGVVGSELVCQRGFGD